ncbi:MAG TPA: NADPH-dependent F420 reductase [Anaerolineae bacterium]|nr:NADPH-dependent F420 reductase [Anaerolineae bacterium]
MTLPTIAVLGGTGKEGRGLALRWAHAGYPIIIGSRDAERAQAAAAELNAQLGQGPSVRGLHNTDAAKACEIAVLSVPYEAHQSTLDSIRAEVQDKILVDVTAPLNPDNKRKVRRISGGSAGEEAQTFLGEKVKVVSAFQNVSYTHLSNLGEALHCDILVCGNDKAAKQQVIELAKAASLHAFDAGPIENSVVAEGLAAVLININIQFKIKNAGIEVTGTPRS